MSKTKKRPVEFAASPGIGYKLFKPITGIYCPNRKNRLKIRGEVNELNQRVRRRNEKSIHPKYFAAKSPEIFPISFNNTKL